MPQNLYNWLAMHHPLTWEQYYHSMITMVKKTNSFCIKNLECSRKGYAQIEQEALAQIYGVQKFHQYLYGCKFTLLTDYKPLTSTPGPKFGMPFLAAAHMLIIITWYIIKPKRMQMLMPCQDYHQVLVKMRWKQMLCFKHLALD